MFETERSTTVPTDGRLQP